MKNSAILTIGEHSTIYVGEVRDINRRQINREDATTLMGIEFERGNERNEKSVFKQEGRNIRTQSFVGTIQIDNDLIIEILPKFIRSEQELDDDSIEQYRDTLIKMIMLSGKNKFLTSHNVSLKSRDGELPMFETLIFFFADALSEELRKGLHREYVRTVGNLTQMKGRLVVNEHLRRNMFNQAKLYVEYEEFGWDNKLMKIFKAAVRLLLDQNIIGAQTKQKLNETLYLLNDVSDMQLTISDFNGVAFHRMNSRFEILFDQCRFLITKLFPFSISADSRTRFWSILFDMDELFERFLAYLFDRSGIPFEDQHSFQAYSSEQGGRHVRGRPDFVFFGSDTPTAVADAKWKLYDPARYGESNMGGLDWANFWQLTSYMYLLGEKPLHGYFIVPAKHSGVPREVSYIGRSEYHPNVTVLTIDFTMPINDILDTHRFSYDRGGKLRLGIEYNSMTWCRKIDQEIREARFSANPTSLCSSATSPVFMEMCEYGSIDCADLSSSILSADDISYTDMIDKFFDGFGTTAVVNADFDYTAPAMWLVEAFSAKDTETIADEAITQIEERILAPTWIMFDQGISRLYAELPEGFACYNGLYSAHIDKIRSKEMKTPSIDVKHFSLNGNKVILFSYERGSILITFTNPSQFFASLIAKHEGAKRDNTGDWHITTDNYAEWAKLQRFLHDYLVKFLIGQPKEQNPLNTSITAMLKNSTRNSKEILSVLANEARSKAAKKQTVFNAERSCDELKQVLTFDQPKNGCFRIGENGLDGLIWINATDYPHEKIYQCDEIFEKIITTVLHKGTATETTNLEVLFRFVDTMAKDGEQVTQADFKKADSIIDNLKSIPQLFTRSCNRRWFIQKALDTKHQILQYPEEALSNIIKEMETVQGSVSLGTFSSVDVVMQQLQRRVNLPSAEKAFHVFTLSNLTHAPIGVVEAGLDTMDSTYFDFDAVSSLMQNPTLSVTALMGYFFSRNFGHGVSERRKQALAIAKDRLEHHSGSMIDFIEMVESKINDSNTYSKPDWGHPSKKEKEIITALGQYISQSGKMYYLWKTLAENTGESEHLVNIYDKIELLTDAQRKIVIPSIVKAKIYQKGTKEGHAVFANLLHKILLDAEANGGENFFLIKLIAGNYLKSEATVSHLFENYADNETILDELVKYANYHDPQYGGQGSELSHEILRYAVSIRGRDDSGESDLAEQLRNSLH